MKRKDFDKNIDGLIINGLIKESEQDNADFAAAMRHMDDVEFVEMLFGPISVEELVPTTCKHSIWEVCNGFEQTDKPPKQSSHRKFAFEETEDLLAFDKKVEPTSYPDECGFDYFPDFDIARDPLKAWNYVIRNIKHGKNNEATSLLSSLIKRYLGTAFAKRCRTLLDLISKKI